MRRSQVDRDLTCRELVELVTAYLDGALPDAERMRFETHMAACEGCDRYVEQIRTTVALTREARALEERPELTALLGAFRHYRRRA
jgi:anti-sigma factor RsiW